MHNKAFPKKKHPAFAALLTIIFGPLGYLYIGWRYALAGSIMFAAFIVIFLLLLFVPPWLKYVNVLPFAFMAVWICQIRNTIIDSKHPDAFTFNTFPVAIFAMTTLLPILAVVDTAAIVVFMAIQRMLGGEIGKGLFLLLLGTPVMAGVHWFLYSYIAWGIDRLVLLFAPKTPTNIFPTSVGRKESVSSEFLPVDAVKQTSDALCSQNQPKTSQDLSSIWQGYRNNPSQELRNMLLTHYLPLVKFNAERLAAKLPDEVELDDLVSAGTFGLLDAIEAFDPERGIKFETYCAPRIRGAIIDKIRSMGWGPRLLQALARKPETTSQQTNRQDPESLITKGFSRTESLIMTLYYYEGMTFKQIGATLDLSEAKVSEIHESILKRLKKELDDRKREFGPDETSSD